MIFLLHTGISGIRPQLALAYYSIVEARLSMSYMHRAGHFLFFY